MKKKEAEVLALKKVDVIVEFIMQILEDTSKVSGIMNFNRLESKAKKAFSKPSHPIKK